MFAPTTLVRDGGANRAFGSSDTCAFSYRHFLVDVIAQAPKYVHKGMQPLTKYRIIGVLSVICTLLLGACGGAEPANFAPAGVAYGQPTFLYLFTEN